MPKITFLPSNVTCEAKPDETILDVAIRCDIPLQHACGGFCACTTCHVWVRSNSEGLGPIEEDEADRLEGVKGFSPDSRLGCQSKIIGDVTVEMVNE